MHTYIIEVDGKEMLEADCMGKIIKAYEAWSTRGRNVRVYSKHIQDITHIVGAAS